MTKNDYIDGDYHVTEYENGTIVKQLISKNAPIEQIEPQATIEEQILAENQYQTALLEIQMLGGM